MTKEQLLGLFLEDLLDGKAKTLSYHPTHKTQTKEDPCQVDDESEGCSAEKKMRKKMSTSHRPASHPHVCIFLF
jgi:hypothetical protein